MEISTTLNKHYVTLCTQTFVTCDDQHKDKILEKLELVLLCTTEGILKMEDDDSSSKVKPKHLERHLVACCSIGHKSCFPRVSRWDMDQTKKSR